LRNGWASLLMLLACLGLFVAVAYGDLLAAIGRL
jgi:hypothetical protein